MNFHFIKALNILDMRNFYKAILTTAIAGTALCALGSNSVLAQDKNAGALKPQSEWSVKPLAVNTDNSYCALSRQYDQNLILTLGKNKIEEYSLAIDFTNTTLNPDRAYSVTLQPGPGQIRAYEMMPASARAMVIRLGYDDSFIQAISESNELKAEIDGKNYIFDLGSFAKGNRSLEECASGLKSVSTTKVASANKILDEKPIKIEKKEARVPLDQAPRPPVEDRNEIVREGVGDGPKLAVSMVEKAAVVEAPKLEPEIKINKVESKPVNNIAAQKADEIEAQAQEMAQKAEAARLLEEQKLAAQKAEEQKQEQLRLAEVAKEKAEAQKAQAEKAQVEKDRAEKERAEKMEQERLAVEKAAKEKAEKERLAAEKARKEKLEQQKLAEQKAKEEAVSAKKAAEALKRQQEVEEQKRLASLDTPDVRDSLTPPPATPTDRPFESRYEVFKTSEEKAAQENLDRYQAENKRLSQALSDEEAKIARLDKASPEAQNELAEIRERMAELEKENRALYLEARQARSAIDTAVVDTSNQALAKMREYEKKLEAARMDNVTLSKEIEELRRIKEDGRLDVIAGDWDLEKSTKRFNEAEREIKRLGMLLEQQRVAHRKEKVELEQMLFDPAVTEQKQRARLAELEAKLAAAERQLQSSAGQQSVARNSMTSMPSVPAPYVPVSPLSERVDVTAPRPPVPNDVVRQNNFPKVEDTPFAVSARQAPPPAPIVPRRQERVREAPPRVSTLAPVAPVEARPTLSISNRVAEPPQAPVTQKPAAPTFGSNDIRQVLSKSGVGVNGQIRQAQAGFYQWQAGKLAGHAEVIPQGRIGNFDSFVGRYMSKKKQSCNGDFASLPAPTIANAKAFEIACVTSTSSMSSSLLFKQKGGDIIIIGHDIPAEDMDLAMDARDRIADNL